MEKHKVLIVDDDILVLNALRRSLYGNPAFAVDFADSSHQAYQKLQTTDYAVVVSDLRMPEIDGLALLKWVAHNQPNVKRILLTGNANREAVIMAVNEASVFRIIQKPWNDQELVALLGFACAMF
jgi:DNA-binding NtrC family response regulator